MPHRERNARNHRRKIRDPGRARVHDHRRALRFGEQCRGSDRVRGIDEAGQKVHFLLRDEFLHRDPAKRRKAATEREIERAEDFYGRLDEAQRAFVVRSIAESPWDGDLAYAERLRRQQDLLAMARRLAASRAVPAEAEAEVRAWMKRLQRSPHENYRRYQVRLVDYNCSYAASLHNLTTAEQRKKAVKKLKGWEDELRALAGDGASS